MCIISVSIDQHADYPFVLAANRDEFYNRRTAGLHWWEDRDILAGKDLEQGGTWLGLNSRGEMAAVTNIRNPDESKQPESRGSLVTSWLENKALFKQKIKEPGRFNGYNLIYGNFKETYYTTNGGAPDKKLSSGFHTLSNANMETSWPKTSQLKEDMIDAHKKNLSGREMEEVLLAALEKQEMFEEEQLPDTGVGLELEKKLSSVYISMDGYGTRSSSLVYVNHHGTIMFVEKDQMTKEIRRYKHQVPRLFN